LATFTRRSLKSLKAAENYGNCMEIAHTPRHTRMAMTNCYGLLEPLVITKTMHFSFSFYTFYSI